MSCHPIRWTAAEDARIPAGVNVTHVTVSSILLNPTTGATIVPTSPSTAGQVRALTQILTPALTFNLNLSLILTIPLTLTVILILTLT